MLVVDLRKTPVELMRNPTGGPIGLPMTAHLKLISAENACRNAQWFTDHKFRHNREEALHYIAEARAALLEAESAVLFDGTNQ